jgi:hypothetical protein
MNVHLPALPARVVLQPLSYRLEGIADHDVDVLVLWIYFKMLLPFFFVAASDGSVQTRLPFGLTRSGCWIPRSS